MHLGFGRAVKMKVAQVKRAKLSKFVKMRNFFKIRISLLKSVASR